MLVIPGRPGKDTCDGVTRREILRVGGSAALGLSLADLLRFKAQAKETGGGGPGWNKAKSVIFVFLQGGPSHLDLWDPKRDVLATIYHACGIDPDTIVYNHLNQPRELVKGSVVSSLFA